MAVETLRPSAAGDECNIGTQSGCSACPNHYDCVDEATPDDPSTCIIGYGADYDRDLYNIADHSVGSGIINHITVYARCTTMAPPAIASLKIAIKTGGTAYESAEKTVTSSWDNYSEQWAQNPSNAHAWTWDEIDALQIGVALKDPGGQQTECTQVYVEVDYTPLTPQAVGSGSIALASALAKYTKLEATKMGSGAISLAGSLLKYTKLQATKMGAGAVSLAGALSPVRYILKAVGGAALVITGQATGLIVAYGQAVGGGAIGIAGSLLKYTKTSVGTCRHWASPTGYNDPDEKWSDRDKVYDENLDTYAHLLDSLPIGTWSSFLELSCSPMTCNSLRVYAKSRWYSYGWWDSGGTVDIDVYDGSWHDVYEGNYEKLVWIEKTFSLLTITKARCRFKDDEHETANPWFFEFDFGELGLPIVGHAYKKMFQATGGAFLDIRGYITQKQIWISVGSGAVSIAGALSKCKFFLASVGSGVISIVGSLATEYTEQVIGKLLKLFTYAKAVFKLIVYTKETK